MSTHPKVSILIPTYNSAQFLDEAIESVVAQTFTDYEVIIVDNCSTDNTKEVVSKYLTDKRFSYFRNDTNLGLVGNWNRCLELANGEYLKYLCADDKFHPEMLEKFVAVMDAHPGVSVVTSNKIYFGSQNKTVTLPFQHLTNGRDIIYKTLETIDFLGDPTCVMLRKSNRHLGGFKEGMIWMVDWEMWIRHLLVGDCYIIPEILVYTRKHPAQVQSTVIKNNFKYRFDEYYFYKNIKEKNPYQLDLTRVDMNGLVKHKAMNCTKEIVFKMIPKLYQPDCRLLFKKALDISRKERVVISAFVEVLGGFRKKVLQKV